MIPITTSISKRLNARIFMDLTRNHNTIFVSLELVRIHPNLGKKVSWSGNNFPITQHTFSTSEPVR